MRNRTTTLALSLLLGATPFTAADTERDRSTATGAKDAAKASVQRIKHRTPRAARNAKQKNPRATHRAKVAPQRAKVTTDTKVKHD